MTEVTVIVPVGPAHFELVSQAILSIESQTVPCEKLIYYDPARLGPAHWRNQGIQESQTPFVVFLDADDWLDNRFVERTLLHFDGKRYVYTDFYASADESHRERRDAPDCAWVNETWHCVTTLLPTEWARSVGGFDEALAFAEDTDFYTKLCAAGYCGQRLPEALFYYRKGGERAAPYVNTLEHQRMKVALRERYGGRQVSCCGQNEPIVNTPIGERQEGDVLAAALWMGNRVEIGKITGRRYPRVSNGKEVWVDPRDVRAAPRLWKAVIELPEALEGNAFHDAVRMAAGALVVPQPSVRPPTPEPVREVKPDVQKLLGLYRQALPPDISMTWADGIPR